MLLSKITYIMLFVANIFLVDSFTTNKIQTFNKFIPIMQENIDKPISSSYLENINNKKLKKLENIKNNISKYIKTENNKIEKGHISTYQPIPKVQFDTIFMNIYNINKIYISYNVDRMIFEMNTGRRFVYYIKNNEDKDRINTLINLIPNQVKCIIINDVKNTMDDVFGFLYCTPDSE